MKSLKNVFIILMAISICLLYVADISAKPRATVEFKISLDKEEYKPNEAINMTFTLKNKGKKEVWVNKRFFLSAESVKPGKRDVYLKVSSPTGEALPCKIDYDTGFPKTDYFELLEPKAEISSERPRNLKGYFDFSKPGTYKIQAVYHNIFGPEIGLDAFSGPIESKSVKTKITEDK